MTLFLLCSSMIIFRICWTSFFMYYLLLFLREGLKVYLSLLCLETHPSQPVSSSRTLPLAKLSSLTQTGPSLLYAGLRLWLVALGMLIPGTRKGHLRGIFSKNSKQQESHACALFPSESTVSTSVIIGAKPMLTPHTVSLPHSEHPYIILRGGLSVSPTR